VLFVVGLVHIVDDGTQLLLVALEFLAKGSDPFIAVFLVSVLVDVRKDFVLALASVSQNLGSVEYVFFQVRTLVIEAVAYPIQYVGMCVAEVVIVVRGRQKIRAKLGRQNLCTHTVIVQTTSGGVLGVFVLDHFLVLAVAEGLAMAYHCLGECTCIALEVATVLTPLLALAKLFGEFALGHTGYVPASRWVVGMLGGYRIGVRVVVC
jgi:hypothetical protein